MTTRDMSRVNWRKSSRSGGANGGGQCVEVGCIHDANWRKSSRSANNGECLQAAQADPIIAVRDSKLPTSSDFPALTMTRDDWTAFLTTVRD